MAFARSRREVAVVRTRASGGGALRDARRRSVGATTDARAAQHPSCRTAQHRRPARSRQRSRRARRKAVAAGGGEGCAGGEGSAARRSLDVLLRALGTNPVQEVRELVNQCAEVVEGNRGMEQELEKQSARLETLQDVVRARRAGHVAPLAVAKRSGSRYSCLGAAVRAKARHSISRIPCPPGTLAHDPDGDAVRSRRSMSAGVILPPLPLNHGEALPGDSVWVYLPQSPKPARKRARSVPLHHTPPSLPATAAASGGDPGAAGSVGPAVTPTSRFSGTDRDSESDTSPAVPLSPRPTVVAPDNATATAVSRAAVDDVDVCFSVRSMRGESTFVPIPIDWSK